MRTRAAIVAELTPKMRFHSFAEAVSLATLEVLLDIRELLAQNSHNPSENA